MEAPNEFMEAIRDGETAKAIQQLYQLVAERGDREAEHDLISIHFDFKENERGKMNGLRSAAFSMRIENQVASSLLRMYEELIQIGSYSDVGIIKPIDEDFKALIVEGKIEKAIQVLQKAVEERGDKDAEQALIMIEASYLEIKKDIRGGMSSEDDLRIRSNKVVRNLLTLREKISANPKSGSQEPLQRVNERFKNLLARGELRKAGDWLENATKGKGEEDFHMHLTAIRAEIAEIESNRNLAILSPEELRMRWNQVTKKLLDIYENFEETEGFPSGENIVVEDQAIKKWSLEGALLSGFGGPKANITSLSTADDRVLSTDKRGNYKVYENGKSVPTQGSPASAARTAIFLPPGNKDNASSPRNYLVGDQKGVIRTYKPGGRMVNEIDLKTGPIKTLACSPDGDKLLVGTNDRAGLYTMEGRALRILGESGELARTGPFGQENDDATPFLQLLPPGVRLTSLVVSDGSLVDSIRINYREGKEAGALIIGETKGKANEEFYANSPISKITGRAGEDLDQLQFHFEDGTKTPVYGGDGGAPFEVMFEDVDFAGFHGQASRRGWVSQLGFFGRLKPEEPVRKAKRKV